MSSTKSTTLHTRSDQTAIDALDQKTWGRKSAVRPGELVAVQGVKPCGKLGRVEHGRILNARVAGPVDGDDEALVATLVYGRRWFRVVAGSSPYRLLSVVADEAPAR